MSERLSRKILSKAEWLALFRDGLYGGKEAFARQVRKLSTRLAVGDPEMAEALLAELGRDTVLRAFQANPVDADSRQKLLMETYPVILPREPVWGMPVRHALDRVVVEWQGAERLREAGLQPTRTVLLSGPPGVGKTLAAHWLAMQLNVPLFTLDLATVMNSFLGKTGQNLRLVLDYALGTKSVLLLDEFDAVAKRRGDDSDVGELKRLVNVLLQAIDNWSGESLLVAATNHPELLDPAAWRRFDLALSLEVPTLDMVRRYLAEHGLEDDVADEIARSMEGESLANVERWLRAARRASLLHGQSFLAAFYATVVRERGGKVSAKVDRDMRILDMHERKLSAREIARELGITHPTVQAVIKRLKGG